MDSKNRWKGLMKSFGRHIDPDKEDHIKSVKTEFENKVKRILKLVKIVDQGNRENRMKIKTNIIQQIEDFQEQYQSLYSLYEDLRGEVRKNVFKDKSTSTTEAKDEEPNSAPPRISTNEGKKPTKKKEDLEGSAEKRKLQERIDSTLRETKELKRKNSELEGQILELEAMCKRKDDDFSALTNTLEEYKSRNEELEAQAVAKQVEINHLQNQRGELKLELENKLKDLQVEINNLQNQKGELELKLENKLKQMSDCLIQIEILNENLRNLTLKEKLIIEEKKGLELQVEDLQVEVNLLRTQRSNLEEKIRKINVEFCESKEELQRKISKLHADLLNKENKLSTQIEQLKNINKELETQKKNYSISISEMEKKNVELIEKIVEREDRINKIKDEQKNQSKSNFQMVERKIEELAKDFRKEFEDNLRILNRRIRLVEQLIAENKEHYLKIKEVYEEEKKKLKEKSGRTKVNVGELSSTVNDMLSSVDTVRLKFEERNTNFLNRISKVSCDIQFAKDWAVRKNRVAMQKDNGKVDWVVLDNDSDEE